MNETVEMTHERVDDIPLLIGLIDKVGIAQHIDEILGTHAHQQGLSNGALTTGWLTFILCEGDHRKYNVQEWAERHRQTLEQLLGKPIRSVEFNDDRLTNLLRRFSRDDAWQELEQRLWRQTIEVYDVSVETIRLDATTVNGYHRVTPEELMQRGHNSKGNDLPQLKLMIAAAQTYDPPIAIPLASDIVSGNRADQPLYTPLIERVRAMDNCTGLLYVGDSKMSSLATRADLARHGEYYLTRLPAQAVSADWIECVIEGRQPVEPIYRDNELIAVGYEITRTLSLEQTEQAPALSWSERVQVLRSCARADRQYATLLKRLTAAEQALAKLTPTPGPGRRQYRDQESLTAAIATIMKRHDVLGLLRVDYSIEQAANPRMVVTHVERQQERIEQARQRLGWSVQVTNLPSDRLSLSQCLAHYRDAWSVERNFHLLKDRPLGIAPLLVHRDDQIIGLTRLLTLALRLLTLAELQLRQSLAQNQEQLQGLYPGQPKRATATPTARAVLAAVARAELTVTRLDIGGQHQRLLTPLPPLVLKILLLLQLDTHLYLSLAADSS